MREPPNPSIPASGSPTAFGSINRFSPPSAPNLLPPTAEISVKNSYTSITLKKVLIETVPNYWLGSKLQRPPLRLSRKLAQVC